MKMSTKNGNPKSASSPSKESSSSSTRPSSTGGPASRMDIDATPPQPSLMKSSSVEISNHDAQYPPHQETSSHLTLSVSTTTSALGGGGFCSNLHQRDAFETCGSGSFFGSARGSRGSSIGNHRHNNNVGVSGSHSATTSTAVPTAPISMSLLPSKAGQVDAITGVTATAPTRSGYTNTHDTGAATIAEEDTKQAESLLAKEMNKLSTEERNRVLDEIHGVADQVEETEEFVSDCLKKMEEEILKIRKRSEYEKALFVKPSAVKDRSFRLMFLRSDNYDPKKAAKRFVSYYHHKLRLFGFDSLVRPITLNDLDVHDKHALYAGSMQFLPIKDKSGRMIVCNFHKYHDFQSSINQIRMCWYLTMAALEDETLQKKGVVTIIYNVDVTEYPPKDTQLMKDGSFMQESLPLRYVSMHFCYNNPKLFPIMNLIQLVVGTQARLRFRAHYGTHVECQYKLLTYGVTDKSLPIDTNGKLDVDTFHKYLKDRETLEKQRAVEKEASTRSLDYVDHPMSNDVVLGRGNPYQQFPGNLRLAQIIDEHRVAYQSAARVNKTAISKMIVQLVKQSNGRFLKKRRKDSSATTPTAEKTTATPNMDISSSAASTTTASRSGSDNEDPDGTDTSVSSNGSSHQQQQQQKTSTNVDDSSIGWIEVSDDVARDKVSHGFRTRTRRNADSFSTAKQWSMGNK